MGRKSRETEDPDWTPQECESPRQKRAKLSPALQESVLGSASPRASTDQQATKCPTCGSTSSGGSQVPLDVPMVRTPFVESVGYLNWLMNSDLKLAEAMATIASTTNIVSAIMKPELIAANMKHFQQATMQMDMTNGISESKPEQVAANMKHFQQSTMKMGTTNEMINDSVVEILDSSGEQEADAVVAQVEDETVIKISGKEPSVASPSNVRLSVSDNDTKPAQKSKSLVTNTPAKRARRPASTPNVTLSVTENDTASVQKSESLVNNMRSGRGRSQKPSVASPPNGTLSVSDNDTESAQKPESSLNNTPARRARRQRRSSASSHESEESEEPFVQREPCCYIYDPHHDLTYCLECSTKRSKPKSKSYVDCRFIGFRRLRYLNGTVEVVGFLNPHDDATQMDLNLWIPNVNRPSDDDDYHLAKRILGIIGNYFCLLAQQENEAANSDASGGVSCASVAENEPSEDRLWKKSDGARETCDVCKSTLFNFHFSCKDCGFAVCVDCLQVRTSEIAKPTKKRLKGKDAYSWPLCNWKPHQPERLKLTQMIPGDCLQQMNKTYHEVRAKLGQLCHCLKDLLEVIAKNTSNYTPETQNPSVQGWGHLSNLQGCTSLLCNGRLLWIKNYQDPYLTRLCFQEQWERGQPVLISGVSRKLNTNLWHPSSFTAELGAMKADLVDCLTGATLHSQPLSRFWDGFLDSSERLVDDAGKPMILKLKDWPPKDDFAKVLPTRFDDLMKALPLPEYTHRSGRLNLVSWLPESFIRPDLGPKMYTAYGSAAHPDVGTTNLHVDMSDAVNVLVYVTIPSNERTSGNDVLKVIRDAGCDELTIEMATDPGKVPGALWHIYAAEDADKIRHLLTTVAEERGIDIQPDDDTIHDQDWYLDQPLRQRLQEDYGVEGYTIVQCWGDAVFIPAGAPHQVLNLRNCIKVAEDFVSPENINQCLVLSNEFRRLSDKHHNHEDKLQIKNILYHAVKGTVGILSGPEPPV